MIRSLILGILIFVALAGCASRTPQADQVLQNRSLPPSYQINAVPFVSQAEGYCGPATLTMAMRWAGKDVTIKEIAPLVFIPGMKGSLQSDLISATRRQGLLAIPIEGFANLLSEIAAGHPVIIFENLGISWIPRWHYALAHGYDLSMHELRLHSGLDANKREDFGEFERSWKLGGYWGLLVLPPGELSVTAGELAQVKAAAALEQIGKSKEAEKSYRRIQQRWPTSLAATIGLANLAFAEKDFVQALQELEKATKDHPQSAMAWHNQTLAQGAANRSSEARQSAREALRLASPEERPLFEESLKAWIQ